jgi:hypothetical protein
MATLIDETNKIVAKTKIKLNLYTNEIHFTNKDGVEMVVVRDAIRKIIFHKSDTANDAFAVFENNVAPIAENNERAENSSYVQVLNQGDIQVLKYTRKALNSADSLFGTMKRYYFSDQPMYYLYHKSGSFYRLSKLNQAKLMDLLPEATMQIHGTWINTNKINFKKEDDFVRFIQYYNAWELEKKAKKTP